MKDGAVFSVPSHIISPKSRCYSGPHRLGGNIHIAGLWAAKCPPFTPVRAVYRGATICQAIGRWGGIRRRLILLFITDRHWHIVSQHWSQKDRCEYETLTETFSHCFAISTRVNLAKACVTRKMGFGQGTSTDARNLILLFRIQRVKCLSELRKLQRE